VSAPLERPDHGTVLRSFAGVVPVDPDAVLDQLAVALKPTIPEGGSFSTDRTQRLLVQQGGWWYRAEYRVLPDPEGSRIEFEIVNVAQPAHWAGPITGRAVLKSAPSGFQRLLSDLR
jgi:hypothetical protein